MNTWRSLAIVIAAWLMLASCAARDVKPKKPEVWVQKLELARVGPRSADLIVTLALRNPNSFSLPVNGVNYDLALNSRRVLLGDSKQEFELPAGGQGSIPLEVTFEYQRIFSSISEALRKRRVVYDLRGSVGIGPFRIPFTGGGEFALQ